MNTVRNILIAFFLLLPLWALSDNTVIVTGRVNRPEALVRLMIYDDLLNMHETLIAETTVDTLGFFILEGEVKQTFPAVIYVGLDGVDFLVTPGAAYDVQIVVHDVDRSVSYFERRLPDLKVKKATDKGIYRQLVISEEIIKTAIPCFAKSPIIL